MIRQHLATRRLCRRHREETSRRRWLVHGDGTCVGDWTVRAAAAAGAVAQAKTTARTAAISRHLFRPLPRTCLTCRQGPPASITTFRTSTTRVGGGCLEELTATDCFIDSTRSANSRHEAHPRMCSTTWLLDSGLSSLSANDEIAMRTSEQCANRLDFGRNVFIGSARRSVLNRDIHGLRRNPSRTSCVEHRDSENR
jgi:hypothetical protein